MNRITPLNISSWMSMLAASLLSLIPAMSVATQSEHEGLTEDQLSVRALMRLEAAQAGALASSASGRGLSVQGRGDGQAARASGPRLVAIYGTDKRLVAQVDIAGNHYLYMQGRSQAMGSRNPEVGYVLEGINRSCVRLKEAQVQHTLCLHPDFREPR